MDRKCVPWRTDVLTWLNNQPNFDMVFLAANAPEQNELRPTRPPRSRRA